MPEKPKFRKGSKSLDEFAKKAIEEETSGPDKEEISDPDSEADELLPWEQPDVRDEKKMISLYIPERTRVMLKYISDQTGVPQQRFLRDIVVPATEKEAMRVAAAKKKQSEE